MQIILQILKVQSAGGTPPAAGANCVGCSGGSREEFPHGQGGSREEFPHGREGLVRRCPLVRRFSGGSKWHFEGPFESRF